MPFHRCKSASGRPAWAALVAGFILVLGCEQADPLPAGGPRSPDASLDAEVAVPAADAVGPTTDDAPVDEAARVEPEPASLPVVTRRDSADVEIVEMDASALGRLPVWTIDPEPATEIGSPDGAAPYVFAQIDPAKVTVLADGNLAVVDGWVADGTREVRIFDSLGNHVRSVGQTGEGPGEFRSLPEIRGTSTGGFLAFDEGLWRITRFDARGEIVSTRTWERSSCIHTRLGRRAGVDPSCGREWGLLGNGNILFAHDGQPLPASPRRPHMQPGDEIDGLRYVAGLGTPSGYLAFRYIPMRPMRVRESYTLRGSLQWVATYRVLTPRPTFAAGANHVAVALRDRYEIEIHNDNGLLERIVRVRMEPVVLRASEKADLLRKTEPELTAAGATDTVPFMGSVRLGEGDDIWVQDFRDDRLHGADAPYVYTIFDVSGEPVARLQVEPDQIFTEGGRRDVPFEAMSGRDYYRVVTMDPFELSHLKTYRILKDG